MSNSHFIFGETNKLLHKLEELCVPDPILVLRDVIDNSPGICRLDGGVGLVAFTSSDFKSANEVACDFNKLFFNGDLDVVQITLREAIKLTRETEDAHCLHLIGESFRSRRKAQTKASFIVG